MGGLGQGHLAYYVAWEAVKHLCGPHHWLGTFALSHWAFGPSVVLEQLTDTARERALPGLVSGRQSMCFGLSEPGAGSDATMITTRAVPDGEGWRISGRKMWTSNVTFADWIVVFAVTDPARAAARRGGISAFLVPTRAPGFTLERVTLLQGDIGGAEGESTFDGVRVEPWQLVGPLHDGFRIALLGVSLGRVYNAARAVGLARWSLEKAVAYAGQRVAFGVPIAEHQGWPSRSRNPRWRCTPRTWPASTRRCCSTAGSGRSRSCRSPRPTPWRCVSERSTGPSRPTGAWGSRTRWGWCTPTTRCAS